MQNVDVTPTHTASTPMPTSSRPPQFRLLDKSDLEVQYKDVDATPTHTAPTPVPSPTPCSPIPMAPSEEDPDDIEPSFPAQTNIGGQQTFERVTRHLQRMSLEHLIREQYIIQRGYSDSTHAQLGFGVSGAGSDYSGAAGGFGFGGGSGGF